MKIIYAITFACAVFSVTGAVAQDVDCEEASDQTSLNICADQDYKAADEALNTAFLELRDGLEQEDADRLKVAQRDWIAYRDAMCAFVGGPTEGASANPMVVSNCLASITNTQTELLLDQSNCEEGDLSCVGR